MGKARDRDGEQGLLACVSAWGRGVPHGPVCVAACSVDPSGPWTWAQTRNTLPSQHMEGGLEVLYLLAKSPDEVHPPQSIKGEEKDRSPTFFLRLRNVTAVVSPNRSQRCDYSSLCNHRRGLFWGFFLGLCLVFPTRFSASRGQRPQLDPGHLLGTADTSPSHDISCSSRYSRTV